MAVAEPQTCALDWASDRCRKHGQLLPGDVVLAQQVVGEERLICVLADGLGSGVKANVLASLTATMALRYAAARRDVLQFAHTLLRSLPVCSVRGISYATFTICDIDAEGQVQIAEYGNPPIVHLRAGGLMPVTSAVLSGADSPGRTLRQAELQLAPGDYLTLMSDGITQAGMGAPATPLGWGEAAVAETLRDLTRRNPPARLLARRLVARARHLDDDQPADDITCAVVHRRAPRRLLLITGPPYARDRDPDLADRVRDWPGQVLVCGGTTAEILARELDVDLLCDPPRSAGSLPPFAAMEGVDLVTEGVITLHRVLQALDAPEPWNGSGDDPLGRLCALLIDSDSLDILLGAGVNQAHHAPDLPAELRDRRRLVEELARVLRSRYCKSVAIELF